MIFEPKTLSTRIALSMFGKLITGTAAMGGAVKATFEKDDIFVTVARLDHASMTDKGEFFNPREGNVLTAPLFNINLEAKDIRGAAENLLNVVGYSSDQEVIWRIDDGEFTVFDEEVYMNLISHELMREYISEANGNVRITGRGIPFFLADAISASFAKDRNVVVGLSSSDGDLTRDQVYVMNSKVSSIQASPRGVINIFTTDGQTRLLAWVASADVMELADSKQRIRFIQEEADVNGPRWYLAADATGELALVIVDENLESQLRSILLGRNSYFDPRHEAGKAGTTGSAEEPLADVDDDLLVPDQSDKSVNAVVRND